MKIGIDLTNFNPNYKNGVGSYTRHLIPSLGSCLISTDELLLILPSDRKLASEIRNLFPNISASVLGSGQCSIYRCFEFIAKYFFKSHCLYGLIKATRSLKLKKFVLTNHIDVIYTPTTYANFKWPVPSLVSLHDTQEKAFPQYFSRRSIVSRDFDVSYTLKTSTMVQVSSEFIRAEIKKYFGQQIVARITMIREGVNLSDFEIRKNNQDSEVKVLFPANFWPHKGHAFLAKAIETWIPKIAVKIVLCGYPQHEEGKLKALYDSRFLDSRIQLLFKSYLSDKELIEEYSSSNIVLSCSQYESSSLPVLEGLAAGCQIVCSNIPAHQELAEILPIKLFAVNEPKSLVAVLENAFDGELPPYDRRILEHQFDWHVVAEKYIDVFVWLSSISDSDKLDS